MVTFFLQFADVWAFCVVSFQIVNVCRQLEDHPHWTWISFLPLLLPINRLWVDVKPLRISYYSGLQLMIIFNNLQIISCLYELTNRHVKRVSQSKSQRYSAVKYNDVKLTKQQILTLEKLVWYGWLINWRISAQAALFNLIWNLRICDISSE